MGKKNSPDKDTKTQGVDTRLARMGNHPRDFHGFVNPPVVHASTVLFPDYETMRTRNQKYTYGTRGTPTTVALCEALDELEGSAGTVLVPSGLTAVALPLLAFLGSGDHCLVLDSVYGPTRHFCDTVLIRLGIEVEYYDPRIGGKISELMRDNTRVVFTESPGSNTFEVQDVPAIVKAAHAGNAVVMIDNTWATPLFFKPLDHGVDISIHALTKYPGGHSDLVMGSISANEKHWKQLLATHGAMGLCATGDDCFLVLRGLRTMGVRLERHQKNALEVAKWLSSHAAVGRVLHPALPEDPGHELWKRDFKGSSGLFGFVLKDATIDQAAAFLDALEFFGLGYSWAGYESLAVIVNLADRTIAKGANDGIIIRLQIGLEDPKDLIADLAQALDKSGVA